MDLEVVICDVLDALVAVDGSRLGFKQFQPGVGPYGEPQLLKLIAEYLNQLGRYPTRVITRRTPDLLIPNEWALEFKITRPFGDNGMEAENWSVNLLHPYPGNVSSIGDCFKLLALKGTERRAVVVIGFEHCPPIIDLTPLIQSFEVIAQKVSRISLSQRIEKSREGLVHPVHRIVRIFAWEVLDILE